MPRYDFQDGASRLRREGRRRPRQGRVTMPPLVVLNFLAIGRFRWRVDVMLSAHD